MLTGRMLTFPSTLDLYNLYSSSLKRDESWQYIKLLTIRVDPCNSHEREDGIAGAIIPG